MGNNLPNTTLNHEQEEKIKELLLVPSKNSSFKNSLSKLEKAFNEGAFSLENENELPSKKYGKFPNTGK